MSGPLSDEENAQLRALLEEDDRDLGTRNRRELLQLLRRDRAWRVQLETHQHEQVDELRSELRRVELERDEVRLELHELRALLQGDGPATAQLLVGRVQGLEAQVVRLAGRVELALEAIGELAAQVEGGPAPLAYVPRAEDDLL